MVNEVRVGALRWASDFTPTFLKLNTSDAVGIPGVNINDRSGGLPDLNIAGIRTICELLGLAPEFVRASQLPVTGRRSEVHPLIVVFAVLFLARYVFLR